MATFQAQFSHSMMVYGIVTLGMDSMGGASYFVKTFKLKTSALPNCEQMATYGGELKVQI